MALSRLLLCSVALLPFVSSCASMRNTLAQDLAEERIQKCSHTGINITRVEPNGRVWARYTADHRIAFNDWNQCMQKAAAEQGQQRTAVAPPPPATGAVSAPIAAVSPGPVSVPVWNRGDEWAYRYESPTGSGTYVWSMDREEAIDGVPHYVIKTGTRELFYRKTDFAFARETVDRAVVLKNTPARLHYVWPMRVGQTWDQTISEERPVARQTLERVDSVTVEAEETISVPAGTFKTLKVVCRNKKTGAIRYEAWYSQELRHVVRLRENLETGLRVRELIAFKLR